MLRINVYITLKKEILDTQGLVIKKAIPQIGYDNVANVRFGKFIQLDIDQSGKSREELIKEIEFLSTMRKLGVFTKFFRALCPYLSFLFFSFLCSSCF